LKHFILYAATFSRDAHFFDFSVIGNRNASSQHQLPDQAKYDEGRDYGENSLFLFGYSEGHELESASGQLS
jgi:hypothetical protein